MQNTEMMALGETGVGGEKSMDVMLGEDVTEGGDGDGEN